MKSYVDKYVKCPFYHREESFKIICEGIDPSTSTVLMFHMQDGLKLFKKSHCYALNSKCPIAKMLYSKYDEVRAEDE